MSVAWRRIPEQVAGLADAFWARVAVDDDIDGDGCWEWLGARDHNGHGKICWRIAGCKVTLAAHRVAAYLTLGDPYRKVVMHRCDNRRCVRPTHLRLGTQAENIRDMDAKGRRRRAS